MDNRDNQSDEDIGERIYNDLKARVIACEFPPGRKIVPKEFLKGKSGSVTPVRESLIRLKGEHLVSEVPNAGFFAKEFSESDIATQYEIQQIFLDRTLSSLTRTIKAPGYLRPPDLAGDIAEEAEIPPDVAVRMMNELFDHIARQSGKPAFVYLIANACDQTHFFRIKDWEFFGDPENRFIRLCQLYCRKDFETLRRDLGVYFELKTTRLPEVFRLLRGATLKAS